MSFIGCNNSKKHKSLWPIALLGDSLKDSNLNDTNQNSKNMGVTSTTGSSTNTKLMDARL